MLNKLTHQNTLCILLDCIYIKRVQIRRRFKTEGLSAFFIQRRRSNPQCPTDGAVNRQTTPICTYFHHRHTFSDLWMAFIAGGPDMYAYIRHFHSQETSRPSSQRSFSSNGFKSLHLLSSTLHLLVELRGK